MLYKKCNEPNCRELIPKHEKYCDEHKGLDNKRYNDTRYKHDKEYVQFYKSSAWLRVRKKALQRDNYCCVECARNGIVKPADLVHHKVEVKNDWDKRLELDNLSSVCMDCHNKIHG